MDFTAAQRNFLRLEEPTRQQKTTRGLATLETIGLNPDVTLGLCEGDCDYDSDCDAGLECFERDGITNVPGCSGDGLGGYDYCFAPSPTDPLLVFLGATPGVILGLCEGDCDDDSDCDAGLECFQRSTLENVPGCNGDGQSGYDYCIEVPSAPTLFPTFSPTTVTTAEPTDVTTPFPTSEPTTATTSEPTTGTTPFPTFLPTAADTTVEPTDVTTSEPTSVTTLFPTFSDTPFPTYFPTAADTTVEPTDVTTSEPTSVTTSFPTFSPTAPPSGSCSDSETGFTMVRYPNYPDVKCSRIAQQLTSQSYSVGSRVCSTFAVEEGGFVVDYCPAMCATYGTGPCA